MDTLLFQKMTSSSPLDDIRALVELARTTFTETFQLAEPMYREDDFNTYMTERMTLSPWLEELADPTNRFYTVSVEGQLAGYLKWTVPHFKYFAQPVPYQCPVLLERCYFLKAFQGQGIAATAVTFALGQAKHADKADYAYLTVWENNLKAQHFYQNLGFRTIGTYLYPVGNQLDKEFLYGKLL
jgi:diamine N-acetyltransferase